MGPDDSKAVAELVAIANKLEAISKVVAHNRYLIEGNATTTATLIEAMKVHTDALHATNDLLVGLLRRIRVLEKENPPAV